MCFSLTDLQNQLTAVLLKQCRTVAIKETDSSYVEFPNQETNMSIQGATTANASAPSEARRCLSMNSQFQEEPQKVNLGIRGRETLSSLHLHGVIVKHQQVCHFT